MKITRFQVLLALCAFVGVIFFGYGYLLMLPAALYFYVKVGTSSRRRVVFLLLLLVLSAFLLFVGFEPASHKVGLVALVLLFYTTFTI